MAGYSSWEGAMRKMMGSTGQGGAPRPPSAGNMGNIAYAPGMMQFGPRSAPSARQMAQNSPLPPKRPTISDSTTSTTQGQTTLSSMPPSPLDQSSSPQLAQQYMSMIMAAIQQELLRSNRARGTY